jgi:predicted DNA-binding antitoxin AbrB/MazE fold protein
MQKTLEVVYEGGLLRPLEPLALREQQHLSIVVDTGSEPSMDFQDPSAYFTPDEWAEAKQDRLSLAELRQSLVPVRLSEEVIDSRLNERY